MSILFAFHIHICKLCKSSLCVVGNYLEKYSEKHCAIFHILKYHSKCSPAFCHLVSRNPCVSLVFKDLHLFLGKKSIWEGLVLILYILWCKLPCAPTSFKNYFEESVACNLKYINYFKWNLIISYFLKSAHGVNLMVTSESKKVLQDGVWGVNG